MEQENPTAETGGASTLERLESFLSDDREPQQHAATDQEVQETAPVDQQPADKQAPTESEDADEPQQESETPNEYQLSDIAKLLGAEESALDVDDDGNIMVKTKVDGQEGKAKFADLLKSYQLQSHVDKQVREAAEQRKALQTQSQELAQQMQVQQALIGEIAAVKSIEAQLAQYQGIDWNALTDNDPVQALKLDRQYRELQQAHYTKSQQIEQAKLQMNHQQEHQRTATLASERQALLNAIPEWKNDATANKERAGIVEDLAKRGYSEKEIHNISDHKAILLARDAMLYRQQQAATKVTEKQIRAAPKIIKPGSSQTRSAETNVQNLKTAVRKSSGSRQSVMDYLLATGKV